LKGELVALFLFVFSICFASFGVPLMLGGSHATTIETLIWQEIRLEGHWSNAVGLSILQFGLLVALATIMGRESATPVVSVRTNHRLLSWMGGLVIVVIPSFMIVVTLVENPFAGLWMISTSTIVEKFIASMSVAVGSGFLVVGILMGIAFLDPRGFARRLLLGAVAPSAVITGFALLILWRGTGVATLVKISIGLALIATPAFYRLRWDSLLVSLRLQRVVARTLGASEGLVFRKIIWPQVIGPACFIAGLSSLWAWGDFALSRVVAEGDVTLALVVQGVMDSYRLDLALTLTWFLILGSAVTYLFFEGAGRVLGSKSQA
jgi:thiamine transport system permease protein